MRSSSVFVTFGAVLIIILLWSIYNNVATAHDPVQRAAQNFFAAVAQQDAAKTEQFVDPSTVTITKVDNKITSFAFTAIHGGGVFTANPTSLWTYTDLMALTTVPNLQPDVANDTGVATILMSEGVKMYLHRMGKGNAAWKVFYISAPKSPQDR